MRDVAIIGVGMTKFGKHLDRSMKDLAREAVEDALKDASLEKKDIQAAYVGNAMAGIVTGQECIRGQVVLRAMGIGGLPVINCENACASASTAFHIAWMSVASGMYDAVLALGMEKLYHADKAVSFRALAAAMDVEIFQNIPVAALQQMLSKAKSDAEVMEKIEKKNAGEEKSAGGGGSRSIFMDLYAAAARMHMAQYGTKPEHFAKISSKHHYHGSLNPRAQYQQQATVEEVLASPMISPPLTRLMCSPIGDGAAACLLVSGDFARKKTTKPVWVAGSSVRSGSDLRPGDNTVVERSAEAAYEMAGIGPEALGCVEVHDATAFGELQATEEMGLCKKGEGGPFAWDGNTTLGGKIPVNTSGGLECKGHPVGATGTAQLCEIYWQLTGRAAMRQINPHPKVGATENGGGAIGAEAAAMSVHVLKI